MKSEAPKKVWQLSGMASQPTNVAIYNIEPTAVKEIGLKKVL